jgi:hypothetical protein
VAGTDRFQPGDLGRIKTPLLILGFSVRRDTEESNR